MSKKVVFLFIIAFCAIIYALIIYSGHPYFIVNKEKSNNYYFNISKSEVRFVPNGNWFEAGDNKLKDVDIKTFDVLHEEYAKDKNYVYFKYQKIKDADPSSFRYLCNGYFLDNYFARDKNMLYYNNHPFQDLDVKSFNFLSVINGRCGSYITDKKHVYSTHYEDFSPVPEGEDYLLYIPDFTIPYIPNIDPENFQFLNESYTKDDKVVYYEDNPIEGADAKTFTALNSKYAKDIKNVYCNGSPIIADSETFTLIDKEYYSKDKNKVYYNCKTVSGADPETFTVIEGGYAKDKKRKYYSGSAAN